jgi:hypothetical protein
MSVQEDPQARRQIMPPGKPAVVVRPRRRLH